ncbi:MAG TPA: hypothetical protein VGR69_08950 [Candidatus Rubrimentiphilum sp.]|nr:hypothetical protein [Candidatus Rubrimentiphilum sp.]
MRFLVGMAVELIDAEDLVAVNVDRAGETIAGEMVGEERKVAVGGFGLFEAGGADPAVSRQ